MPSTALHLPLSTVAWWLPSTLGLAVLGGVMFALWGLQRRTGNAAVVDLGWTAGLGVLAVAYALTFEGLAYRRAFLGALIGLWSLRLGVHLWRDRVRRGPEEGRYQRLRQMWGARAQSRLLVFFLAQALLAVLLSLAFIPGMRAGHPLGALDVAALALWLVALGGEALADAQLRRFKADPANASRVFDGGLWGWSRHPNYFFEWLLWVAFVLPGVTSPLGPLTLLAPAAMLFFILKVTGIPPTEAQALRSRGEAYRAYQARVSAFFPRPPRTESTP